MKVTQSGNKITAFGGFNFCHEFFKKSGIPGLINQSLGQRVKTIGFSYSDIFTNHLAIFLNGGDCTEDINEHLRESLNQIPDMQVCSADTILRGVKELSTSVTEYISPSGVHHEFNINVKLNRLLVKSLIMTGQLNRHSGHTLDYDNQVIPTEKYDTKTTYKKCKGYQSGIASIGKLIVSIEGRNGNSPATYKQAETLHRTFSLLANEKIKVNRFRADSASYQKEVVDLVTSENCLFYVRARRCANMEQQIGNLPKTAWQKIRLGVQQMEVAEIPNYQPFGEEKPFRLVVSRIKRKDKQADVFSGTSYTYRSIMTNDQQWDEKQVVSFYNQRGSAERTFDAMNNDFGWANLPCSFLNENTAFMIMTALYANFYQYMINCFSEKIPWIKNNFRLKKFIFRFITVPAKWIKTGRRNILKLYTQKDYHPLAN